MGHFMAEDLAHNLYFFLLSFILSSFIFFLAMFSKNLKLSVKLAGKN